VHVEVPIHGGSQALVQGRVASSRSAGRIASARPSSRSSNARSTACLLGKYW
jgi:hypothetical protein